MNDAEVSAMSNYAFRAKMDELAKKTAARKAGTRSTIYENCKEKYEKTQKLLDAMKVKKEKLEQEIARLEQKQSDRLTFLEETEKVLEAE